MKLILSSLYIIIFLFSFQMLSAAEKPAVLQYLIKKQLDCDKPKSIQERIECAQMKSLEESNYDLGNTVIGPTTGGTSGVHIEIPKNNHYKDLSIRNIGGK